MKTLREQLIRIRKILEEWPSEAESKRRQVNVEELIKMDRPGSLVRVIGFISLPSEQLKRSSLYR